MKILTTVLSYSGTQNFLNACLDTWIKDIQSPHEYVIYGDATQAKQHKNCWNCSPDTGEARVGLSKKTLKMFNKALTLDWDFLFKCDDDSYVQFPRLVKYLQQYDAKKDLYCGLPIAWPDWPPPYAQGGAGYVLTRSALLKCLTTFELVVHDPVLRFGDGGAEDANVAIALWLAGISLTPVAEFHTVTSPGEQHQQSKCVNAILRNKKITTHYASPRSMRKIYRNI